MKDFVTKAISVKWQKRDPQSPNDGNCDGSRQGQLLATTQTETSFAVAGLKRLLVVGS
jgi:hypothetical protein